jgi:hypothetical protein
MLWKGLALATNSASPIVVVLSYVSSCFKPPSFHPFQLS